MNKSSINILTLLIIGVTAMALLLPAIDVTRGLFAGLDIAQNTTEVENIATPVDVMISYVSEHDELITPRDTITMADGTPVPSLITHAILMMPPGHIPDWVPAVYILLTAVIVGAYLWMMVMFIRFIININKGVIFEHCNVRLLRTVALCLIIMATLEVATGLIYDSALHHIHFADKSMHYDKNWELPSNTLIMGLLSLLMGQVWSRGIAMREEQELTI